MRRSHLDVGGGARAPAAILVALAGGSRQPRKVEKDIPKTLRDPQGIVIRLLPFAFMVLPFGGCSSPPPKADDVVADVREQVSRGFRDPSSVQLRDLKPCEKANGFYGEVNAKNGYGGYEGFKPFVFVASATFLEPSIRKGKRALADHRAFATAAEACTDSMISIRAREQVAEHERSLQFDEIVRQVEEEGARGRTKSRDATPKGLISAAPDPMDAAREAAAEAAREGPSSNFLRSIISRYERAGDRDWKDGQVPQQRPLGAAPEPAGGSPRDEKDDRK
jgi:hypothetical protein